MKNTHPKYCSSLILCLVATTLAAAQQQQIRTGWSDGKAPDPSKMAELVATQRYVPETNVCPEGSYIESFGVKIGSESDAGTEVADWIVDFRAICTNGDLLRPVTGSASSVISHVVKQDEPASKTGFRCVDLTGRNNADQGWMTGFRNIGALTTGTPLKVDCTGVPQDYVAMGYAGYAGSAVDAVKFIMAPRSQVTGTPSPSPSPSPPVPSPSPVPAESKKQLSTPVFAGAVAGSVVGVIGVVIVGFLLVRCCRRRKPRAVPADAVISHVAGAHKGASAAMGAQEHVVMVGRCLDEDDR